RLAKAGHPRRRRGFGVGLERDLGVGRDVERLAARRHETRDLRRLEQRRGPAAEEDRVSRAALGRSNLALERRHVPILQPGLEEPAVEVAVVADGAAERYVQV